MALNRRHRTLGLTLMEIMIAIFILSVGVLSMIGIFGNISKSIHISKSKSLANNLAQEKIESLKNLSYYRLLVTTAAVLSSEAGIPAFHYDQGYYPPENLTVGDIRFERRVFVQKVTESTGTLVNNNWYDNDTGLKLITSHVVWREGDGWRKLTLTNVRDNPNRRKIDARIIGTVSSGAALQDATVFTLQNGNLRGVTSAAGSYSIDVPAGSYQVKATKRGYFPGVQTASVTTGTTATLNFSLQAMGVGTVTGNAYLNNNFLISEACPLVDGDDLVEYVELYNPTSAPILMSSLPGEGNYIVNYVRKSDGATTAVNPDGSTVYVNPSIPAYGYYLIASTPTVAGVAADAYYSDGALVSGVPQNRFPTDESGGLAVVSKGVFEVFGTTVDAVGWGRSGGAPYGPANAREGTGLRLVSGVGADGVAAEEVIERIAYSSSTHATMDNMPAAGIHSSHGNAYDSNDNALDWVHHTHTDNDRPQNSGASEAPQSGTPAVGALVFLDDGLSPSGVAGVAGSFTVNNVATGTWNILVSSQNWVYNNSAVVVTNGVTTALGNTTLNSAAIGGFASGRVVTSGGAGLAGIRVSASGESDVTNGSGYYWLPLEVGTYTVIANQNNENSQYTVGQSTDVVIGLGLLVHVPDIVVFNGGILRGWMTTNGTDPLPGIPLIATSAATGAEVGSAISNELGYFYFPDLPVGTYGIAPQLEPGESSSPVSVSSAVVAATSVFVSTFRVTNAFGRIEGVATRNGSPIKTGVLVVAVPNTTALPATPPTNDNSLRTSGVVYYQATTDSEGRYILPVRGGLTYNVRAWHATYDATTSSVSVTGTFSVPVTPAQSATRNFAW